jgi:hypothetical protein
MSDITPLRIDDSCGPRHLSHLMDEYESNGGLFKMSVRSMQDLTTEIDDGSFVLVESAGTCYLVDGYAAYLLSEHFLHWYYTKKDFQSGTSELGNTFMLYQALEDLLKIDRFDLADVEHDEKFEFARKALGNFN